MEQRITNEVSRVGGLVSDPNRSMGDCLTRYFRCPEHYFRFALKGPLSETDGFIRFADLTLYGRCHDLRPANSPAAVLHDTVQHAAIEDGTASLPFDTNQVADSLRNERYTRGHLHSRTLLKAALKAPYYFVRPILPRPLRKRVQRLYLRDWTKIRFPQWPVDTTVDKLFEHLLLLSLQSGGRKRIPFIWFWPKGAPACAMITHDVETERGKQNCTALMDLDDAFGIRPSFQFIPERRYKVTQAELDALRKRRFEIAVQDLNHDGRLFKSRRHFADFAARINRYGREWDAKGFRAAILYRRQEWFDELQFEYDMSVSNVAHLEPQRGGCCTVMPYFIGDILELPVTTAEDYSLFHILNDYSLDLRKQQCALILQQHGLMSFIIHSDYSTGPRNKQ